MANQIVVNAAKVERIKSRVLALQSEITETTNDLRSSDFSRGCGAGARSLTAMGNAVAHAGMSLGSCAHRCACMLQNALETYEAADERAAREMRR